MQAKEKRVIIVSIFLITVWVFTIVKILRRDIVAERYSDLANEYKMMDKQEEAIAAYKKAIEIKANYTKAYYELGILLSDKGFYEESIALFEKAIEIEPNAKAYVALGIVYFRVDKQAEGIKALEQAIEIDPNNATAYYNLSVAYFKQGYYQQAIEYADKAEELGYDNPNLIGVLKAYRK